MNWPTVKIGDVCDVKRGTTITEKQAIKGAVPVVAGGISYSYKHNKANRLANVITVSASGANAGYVNFWDVPIFASDCSTVEPIGNNIDIRFIFYFLRYKQDFINQTMRSGAAQPHVYAKDIAQISLNLPPLAEQKRIAAILDKANEIKAKRELTTKYLEQLISSLFKQLLIDNKESMKFMELEKCLLKIIDYRGKTPVKTSSGVPLITARVVKNGELLEPTEFIAHDDYDRWMIRGLPEYGDILFTTEAPLGEVATLTRTDVALAQRLLLLRANPIYLTNTFLRHALTSEGVVDEINTRSTGSTVKGIRQKELRKVIIPIIRIDDQKIFTRKIEEIESLRFKQRSALKIQEKIISALQNQAFATGFNA